MRPYFYRYHHVVHQQSLCLIVVPSTLLVLPRHRRRHPRARRRSVAFDLLQQSQGFDVDVYTIVGPVQFKSNDIGCMFMPKIGGPQLDVCDGTCRFGVS